MNDGLNFLEAETQEELCSEDELELRYRADSNNDLKWDDELAEILGFLEEEQQEAKRRFTREERIAACGSIGHTMNHKGELVTAIYYCGCLECPRCFERAVERETLRLGSAIHDSNLYITIIPSHKNGAAKKHIRRHDGLYRQYPSITGRDVYVVDEAAKLALSSHSRMHLRFTQLTQPALTWKKVLKYVPRRRRSGSLGKPRIIKLDEEEKVRIIFPRVIMHEITAKQKRELWLEAMGLTDETPELSAEAIQEACEIRFNTWVGLCEYAGADVNKFGVQVRLVPISQLKDWIRGCDIRPTRLYAMCPDYIQGTAVGTREKKEPELVFA